MKRFYLCCLVTVFFITVLWISGGKGYAAEQRAALVIGNAAYGASPLKNPVNDAADVAANLLRLGFSVTLKQDASHQEMEEAIREFGELLRKGGVGLFFYAGHGVQIGGRNYLLPVGARIKKEMDFKFKAVDVEEVLAEMGNAGNPLNIVILDACRDNPYGRSFRSASRGLAIISDAPRGTFISYSTSPGRVAVDGAGRNSPYTESLLRHINTPGLPIEEVFKSVRKDMGKKTRGQQVPWELSSLEGQFFFRPGIASDTMIVSPSADLEEKKPRIDAERERLRQEQELEVRQKAIDQQKLEAQRQALEEQKHRQQTEAERRRFEEERVQIEKEREEILQRKKALADEKRRLSEELERAEAKKKIDAEAAEAARQAARTKKAMDDSAALLAMAKPPSITRANEIKRDGRFIAYDDATVLDTKTNLMWAAKDNGANIAWDDAKSYCEKYKGGGYADWRMPTSDELAGLYDSRKTSKKPPASGCGGGYHITELIHLTCCCPWASETRPISHSLGGALLDFGNGGVQWHIRTGDYNFFYRALPVRSAK